MKDTLCRCKFTKNQPTTNIVVTGTFHYERKITYFCILHWKTKPRKKRKDRGKKREREKEQKHLLDELSRIRVGSRSEDCRNEAPWRTWINKTIIIFTCMFLKPIIVQILWVRARIEIQLLLCMKVIFSGFHQSLSTFYPQWWNPWIWRVCNKQCYGNANDHSQVIQMTT